MNKNEGMMVARNGERFLAAWALDTGTLEYRFPTLRQAILMRREIGKPEARIKIVRA